VPGIQDLVSTINAVVVAVNISSPFGAASGSGDTITATLPITSDFSDGGMFIVRANAANTGAANTPNLQINSYASRRIKKIGGVALIANDIVSGMNMVLVYNESQDCYYLINHEATFLKRDGTAAMLAALNMGSQKITNLANGTDNGDAVNKSQLDAKALITGSAAQEFAVAAATGVDNAVNKAQFDAKTGLATTTVAGIVEKATLLELIAATANKYPDAALLLTGFDNQGASMDLPDFLGNYGIRCGSTTAIVASEGTITVTFSKDFPTACLHASAIYSNSGASFGGAEDIWVQLVSADYHGAVFYLQSHVAQPTQARTISWFAIGR